MKRLRTTIKRIMVAVMFVCLLVHITPLQQVDAAAECCDVCIGKTSKIPYDYDPVVFAECKKRAPDGICCFECGTFGTPEYGDAVSFASDGTTGQIKTGGWIKFQWSEVEKVTYIQVRDQQNEKKKNTPTIRDTEATLEDGYFFICAKSVGTIYFRGWGKDVCRQATPEIKVLVTEGSEDSDTCDAKGANSPLNAKKGLPDSVKDCNLNRAVVKDLPSGEKTCECTADWAGPPECVGLPWWKWAFTIGGGLAAVFSIAVSVRAFLNKKKKREEEEMRAEEEDFKRDKAYSLRCSYDDMEPLDIHAEPPPDPRESAAMMEIMESPSPGPWKNRSDRDRDTGSDRGRRGYKSSDEHQEYTL